MKFLIPFLLLFSFAAHAQFSVVEYDASNRFTLLGKQWTPSFFNLTSAETEKFNDEGGRLSTYNYFTFATFLESGMRFKLRIPFTYATAGTDRFNGSKQNGQEFDMQDVILNWQDSDMWLLPWDIGNYWEFRVYLPTSKFARDSGKIATVRNEVIFTKMFHRDWGLEYDQKLYYHFQSRTVYPSRFTNENGFEIDAVSATKRFEIDHWVNAFYRVTNKVSVGYRLGWEDTWYNKSTAENKVKQPEHLIKTGPGVKFPITSNANFLLSYEDKVNSDTNRAEFGKFLAKNTTWTLLSFVTF